MDWQKLLTFIKSLPRWSRVTIILAAAAAAIAVSLSSCSRSTLAFKGTGEVEFVYKGTNGPQLSSSER